MNTIGVRRGGWRRTLAGIGAGLAVGAASVIAFAVPAQAAPSGCSLGYTCLYSGYNYTQDWFYSTLAYGYCVDDFTNYGINDSTSSVFNNGRTDDTRLYLDTYKRGVYTTILQGHGETDLGTRGWNDKASSAYFVGNLGDAGTSRCN